jgi:hypothetical protein
VNLGVKLMRRRVVFSAVAVVVAGLVARGLMEWAKTTSKKPPLKISVISTGFVEFPSQAFDHNNFPIETSLRSPGPGLLAVKATGKSVVAYHDAPVFWYVDIRKDGGETLWQTAFDQPEQMFAAKKDVEFKVLLPEFTVPVHFPPGPYRAFVALQMVIPRVDMDGEVVPIAGIQTNAVTLEAADAEFAEQLDPIQ